MRPLVPLPPSANTAGRRRRRTRGEGPALKRFAATIFVAASVAIIWGCGPAAQDDGAAERAANPPGEGNPSERRRTTEANHASDRLDADQEKGAFVATAESRGGTADAADRIRGVEFKIFEGYERVLIGFGRRDGDAPGVPAWSLESPPEGGYVRLRFPGVSSTATGDKNFIGSTVDRLYVVGDPGGGLFVDVFALSSFRYRVTELPDTGQLVVDFRSAMGERRFPPTTGENAVVVQPREAQTVSSPLTIEGYSRLPEAQTYVSLIGRNGEMISSKMVRANDRVVAWDAYETTLKFSGYEGIARLLVGGEKPSGYPGGVTFEGTATEIVIE